MKKVVVVLLVLVIVFQSVIPCQALSQDNNNAMNSNSSHHCCHSESVPSSDLPQDHQCQHLCCHQFMDNHSDVIFLDSRTFVHQFYFVDYVFNRDLLSMTSLVKEYLISYQCLFKDYFHTEFSSLSPPILV